MKIKALVVSAEKATANNGSEYLRIRFCVENQERASVLFSDNLPDLEAINGVVCELEMTKSNYRGKSSDKITSITPTADDPAPYVRRTEINVGAVSALFLDELKDDPEMLKIVQAVFANKKVLERFVSWPGAKEVHHAYMGGLIEHTYGMLEMAKAAMANDPANKGLDRGVVLASVILHDIGKIMEIDFKPGAAPQRANVGILIGHISLADEFLCKVCNDNGIPTRQGRALHLRHCILAHHGKREWGSPVVPATREAVLVHQLDMLQSRGQMAMETIGNIEPGTRAEYNKQMDVEMVKF